MRKLLIGLGILGLPLLLSMLGSPSGRVASVSAQGHASADDAASDEMHLPPRRGVRAAELAFSLTPGQTKQLPLPRTASPITVIVGASHSGQSNGERGMAAVVYVSVDPNTGKLFSWAQVVGDNYSTINDAGPGGPGPFDGIQIENHSADQGDPQTISYNVSIWW